jgi:hypothetical protein
MRPLFWAHQKVAYALLLKTTWQTLDRFVRRDPQLKGKIGAHAVLHTNNRRLDYHPHGHMLVPAGAINKETSVWTSKKGDYLFNEMNLAKVFFRGKWFDAMKRVGLSVQETLPMEWVVNCKAVGGGEKALIYLGRCLYRGVLPEKNILSDMDGVVTFQYVDNEGQEKTRSIPGGEFLWLLLLLLHVLPRRFRRVRDFGLLHANAKRLVQIVQLILNVRLPWPKPPREKTPIICPDCGALMHLLAVRLRADSPLLC